MGFDLKEGAFSRDEERLGEPLRLKQAERINTALHTSASRSRIRILKGSNE